VGTSTDNPAQTLKSPWRKLHPHLRFVALRRAAFVLGVVAALALIGACGSGANRAAVAGGANSKSSSATTGICAGNCRLTRMINYARCMRANGVPSFADPVPVTSPSGKPGWRIGYSGNPSGAFLIAEGLCKHYLPAAASSPAALTPKQQQAWLEWAACIRSHGFPSFPDPVFSGEGVAVPSLPGGDLTKAGVAQRACAHYLAGT
jgi:hypothetical protein